MGISASRKQITDIAKADFTGLGYNQRLDLMAKALGFGTAAEMMATLNKDETPKPGSAPASRIAVESVTADTPIRVLIAYGTEYSRAIDDGEEIGEDDFGELTEKTFATQGEMNAYFEGMNEGNGWDRYSIAASTEPDLPAHREGYFAAVDANPELGFVDWHNARILEEELADDEAAPSP